MTQPQVQRVTVTALATSIEDGGESRTYTSDSRTDRHKSGYNSRWEKTFPWVYHAGDVLLLVLLIQYQK